MTFFSHIYYVLLLHNKFFPWFTMFSSCMTNFLCVKFSTLYDKSCLLFSAHSLLIFFFVNNFLPLHYKFFPLFNIFCLCLTNFFPSTMFSPLVWQIFSLVYFSLLLFTLFYDSLNFFLSFSWLSALVNGFLPYKEIK